MALAAGGWPSTGAPLPFVPASALTRAIFMPVPLNAQPSEPGALVALWAGDVDAAFVRFFEKEAREKRREAERAADGVVSKHDPRAWVAAEAAAKATKAAAEATRAREAVDTYADKCLGFVASSAVTREEPHLAVVEVTGSGGSFEIELRAEFTAFDANTAPLTAAGVPARRLLRLAVGSSGVALLPRGMVIGGGHFELGSFDPRAAAAAAAAAAVAAPAPIPVVLDGAAAVEVAAVAAPAPTPVVPDGAAAVTGAAVGGAEEEGGEESGASSAEATDEDDEAAEASGTEDEDEDKKKSRRTAMVVRLEELACGEEDASGSEASGSEGEGGGDKKAAAASAPAPPVAMPPPPPDKSPGAGGYQLRVIDIIRQRAGAEGLEVLPQSDN